MVQRRAARFVTGIYERYASVSDMLQHLQWDTLENRRNNFQAISKLNKRKFKLCLPEISYMGHRLSKDGLIPDPDKVKAISNMPRPD